MFLEGRPPVNVGVTSDGDVFGGTAISFADVLGDQQFNMFVASIAQYRTFSPRLRQPVAALPVRPAGLLADAVLLRAAGGQFYDPALSGFINRDQALATRTGPRRQRVRHLSAQSLPPRRAVGRRRQLNESTTIRPFRPYSRQYQQQNLRPRRSSATARWCRSASTFVQETTVFREFGPLAGNTMRLGI